MAMKRTGTRRSIQPFRVMQSALTIEEGWAHATGNLAAQASTSHSEQTGTSNDVSIGGMHSVRERKPTG